MPTPDNIKLIKRLITDIEKGRASDKTFEGLVNEFAKLPVTSLSDERVSKAVQRLGEIFPEVVINTMKSTKGTRLRIKLARTKLGRIEFYKSSLVTDELKALYREQKLAVAQTLAGKMEEKELNESDLTTFVNAYKLFDKSLREDPVVTSITDKFASVIKVKAGKDGKAFLKVKSSSSTIFRALSIGRDKPANVAKTMFNAYKAEANLEDAQAKQSNNEAAPDLAKLRNLNAEKIMDAIKGIQTADSIKRDQVEQLVQLFYNPVDISDDMDNNLQEVFGSNVIFGTKSILLEDGSIRCRLQIATDGFDQYGATYSTKDITEKLFNLAKAKRVAGEMLNYAKGITDQMPQDITAEDVQAFASILAAPNVRDELDVEQVQLFLPNYTNTSSYMSIVGPDAQEEVKYYKYNEFPYKLAIDHASKIPSRILAQNIQNIKTRLSEVIGDRLEDNVNFFKDVKKGVKLSSTSDKFANNYPFLGAIDTVIEQGGNDFDPEGLNMGDFIKVECDGASIKVSVVSKTNEALGSHTFENQSKFDKFIGDFRVSNKLLDYDKSSLSVLNEATITATDAVEQGLAANDGSPAYDQASPNDDGPVYDQASSNDDGPVYDQASSSGPGKN